VFNEKGEVINWQFTASEGFEEVKELFIELKNGLQPDGAKVICIDYCCKWNQLLKAIFPTTEVKQDLFHAVQRFCKTLKKKIHSIENCLWITEEFFAILKIQETKEKWTRQMKRF
jgi:tRNA(Met) C34 N-acetyltransferase TmcA